MVLKVIVFKTVKQRGLWEKTSEHNLFQSIDLIYNFPAINVKNYYEIQMETLEIVKKKMSQGRLIVVKVKGLFNSNWRSEKKYLWKKPKEFNILKSIGL